MDKKLLLSFKSLMLVILLISFKELFVMLIPVDFNSLSLSVKVLFNFIADLIFLTFIIILYKDTLFKDFKNFIKDLGNNLETAFKYWLIGFIIMIISNLIIVVFVNGAVASNEETVRSLISIAPIYMIFSVSS